MSRSAQKHDIKKNAIGMAFFSKLVVGPVVPVIDSRVTRNNWISYLVSR
jgi:hypothetical protein